MNQLPMTPPPGFNVPGPLRESAYMPDDADVEQGFDLGKYVAALLRYKWLVLGIALIGTGLVVVASRYMPLRYTANATLMVGSHDTNSEMQGPIQSSQLLQSVAWLELLRSYKVMDYVVEEQRLYLAYDPQFAPVLATFRIDSAARYRPGEYRLTFDAARNQVQLKTAEGAPVEPPVAAGAPVGLSVGFSWQPSPPALAANPDVKFTVMTPRDAAGTLRNRVVPQMAAQEGNFIRLEYTSGDPEQVAAVLNAVADRFVSVAAELKGAKLRELRDILWRQLDQADQQLTAASMALENFQVETATLPSDPSTPVTPGLQSTQSTVLSNFFELKIQRDALLRDRDAIQRSLGSDGSTLSIDALAVVPAVHESLELRQTLTELAEKRGELRALRLQYTDDYKDVKIVLGDIQELEQQTIPRQAAGLMADLERRAAARDSMVSAASEELRQIPPRAIDQARHQRAVAIAETIYNELRSRYESARLATETTIPDLSVLDRALVPHEPNEDQRMRIIMLGAMASFGLAILLALVLDRLDPRLRYPEQVTRGLHLPILGAVPFVPSARRSTDQMHALEALRALRLSLTSAYGSAGPMVLTISSPGAADGKTFLCANLAMSFADLGLRVLLIDGDTRRGDLHRVLEINRKPGLTDFLAGDVDLPTVIQTTRFQHVDCIGCGTHRSTAPELLSSSRMGDLLAGIRPDYDVILLDSPPLGAGIDPLVLATLSGNLMLVMRTGMTDRTMAEAKLEMLERLPVRVLGVALNGVPASGVYKYYSYIPGYEATDEEPTTIRPALQPG
jgi:succinoglycan biosynthesis transport protein ExoP